MSPADKGGRPSGQRVEHMQRQKRWRDSRRQVWLKQSERGLWGVGRMRTKVISYHLIPFFSSQHPTPTTYKPTSTSFFLLPRPLSEASSFPGLCRKSPLPLILDPLPPRHLTPASEPWRTFFSLPPRPPLPFHLAVHLFRPRQALHPLPHPKAFSGAPGWVRAPWSSSVACISPMYV